MKSKTPKEVLHRDLGGEYIRGRFRRHFKATEHRDICVLWKQSRE